MTLAALALASAAVVLAFVPPAWGWGVPAGILGLLLAGPAWDRSRDDRTVHLLAWAAIVVAVLALGVHLLVYLETLPFRERT